MSVGVALTVRLGELLTETLTTAEEVQAPLLPVTV
jgi:hypothetical protein